MSDWTSGYVAEIDYSYNFTKHMAPSHLLMASISQKQKSRLDGENLTYCELGCGQGFTANLLAAANPQVEFHAMDFNPAQIAGAQELARDGEMENVHFYECSFEDFGEQATVPDSFDVIAMHGILSWVSEENRRHIFDFVAKRLKPGGILYASFNTLSAWASAVPLRRLMLDHSKNSAKPITERLYDAISFAERVEQSGAKFFSHNQSASARLGSMPGMPPHYLIHEMFNDHWTPFHFADLAAEMDQAKLSLVGSSILFEHVDDICLNPRQIALLEEESDRIRRETLRDVLVNEQFRSDLFVKGKLPMTERGSVGAWFETTLALTAPFNGGPLKLAWRQGDIPLNAEEYLPVLEALKEGPATVRELLDQGAFGTMTWAQISRLLQILIGAEVMAPCLPMEGLQSRTESCRKFNLAICKRAEDSENLQFLASPLTGNGVEADRLEQLFLLARSEGHVGPNDWADLAWRILAPQGQRLQSQGRLLETDEENLAFLRARANSFAARRLPLFAALGIDLEPEAEADKPIGVSQMRVV
ncbi:class I SAM-dependent methyltransferase [Roseobacter sp. SK209-2-6]|uniref:class I SAM-dependent methyltransferase n=1 Tax=Roseobacter sp. SK209-2-6 TaxID=388739 RepID=UPI000309D1CC|nr:class I SAM-dependent methyltransferase [Roseobacter sp. SK209-2-6]